eukprot:TRINITY_DN27282_c0_g1_i1.p1 TRINITY_DN27282_c0_g1~~TRINITY_DN27282_c0_g1_i1.p1  ORF type:complete len:169 (+),score=27.84 TRINITY_DN27282_c0_g1_i1:2-508(+)
MNLSPFEPPPDYDSWSYASPSATTASCSYCSTSSYSAHPPPCALYYPGPPPPARWSETPERGAAAPNYTLLASGAGRWMQVSKSSFIIKRWALILLILVMLIMVSLLFGITLQHVQLLRSVAHLHPEEARAIRGQRPDYFTSPTESSVLKHRPIHHSFGRNTYSEKDW